MNKLIETAKEIDRILKSGIEIHPNSPIHEKLQQALKILLVNKSTKHKNKIKVDDPNAPWNWKKDSSEL